MLLTPDDSLTTPTNQESVMAKYDYSADSAPPPPPGLVFEFRSGVTGAATASVSDRGSTTASTSLPGPPSSIS